MTLLAPLALLSLLSVPVVIFFYILRVRLQQREVSSTYLWQRLLRDLSARDPWQRPRFTLLMLIQILFLVLLAVALARPAWQVMARENVFAVIVIDTSASLQATDITPNRFEQVRRMAAETVRQLPAGSTVAVMAAGHRPEMLVSETDDPDRALAGLEGAQSDGAALDLPAALRLANAISAGHTHPRIDVFTDGAFDLPSDLPGDAAPIHYHLSGSGTNNQAITAISARADPQNSRRYQAYVRMHNFAQTPVAVTLALYADGTLFDSRNIAIEGESDQELIIDRLPDSASAIEARLVAADDLAVDNAASTVIERRKPTKTLLVSAGNIFLERALTVLPNVELYRAGSERYASIDVEPYDIIIFDGVLPPALPAQNMLLVNPPDSPLMSVEGTLDRVGSLSWQSGSAILRYVAVGDFRLQRAAKVTAPGWAKALIEADGNPLLLSGELERQRILMFTFALQQSNLPLSATFPILMSNMVGYLEPQGVLSQRTIAAGKPLTINPLPRTEDTTIVRPDGTTIKLPQGASLRYDQTDQAGVYAVEQTVRGAVISREHFAVNLVDENESNIGARIAPGEQSDHSLNSADPVPTQQEFWPWLVLAGLGVLTGEWWWYHRRA